MTCSSCGKRTARRACPALGSDICSVCCGTKRLVEIRCPDGCRFLASGREHPPASVVRQREADLARLVSVTRDYSDRQAELFLTISNAVVSFPGTTLQPVIDADVADAAGALAQTLETAARGLIYEQRPASLAAARLVDLLRPAVTRLGEGGGSAFERDAAVVFRDIERLASARGEVGPHGDDRTAGGFLNLIRRTLGPGSAGRPAEAERDRPRLIVP